MTDHSNDQRPFSLKEALAEAAKAATRLKEAAGQSTRGRQCAIVLTDIEKVQALQAAWDL